MSMQDIIISAFLREPQFAGEYVGILDEDMFSDPHHKILVNCYLDYMNSSSNTTRNLPTDVEMFAQLDAHCKKYGVDATIKQHSSDTLKRCYSISFSVSYARDNFLRFATQNKVTKAVIEAAKIIKNKGDQMTDKDYESIAEMVDVATSIKNRDTAGILLGDVAADPVAFIESMNKFDKALVVPTGFKTFDNAHIAGGLLPGEVGAIVAPPGRGKSTILVNMGAHAIVSGKDVVHIFVGDNSEADGVLRYCSRLTGVPMSQIMLNSQQYLQSWSYLSKNFQLGKLLIGAYPIDGPTVADIRSFVTRNMIRKGVHPRLIIIDYPDNCKREEGGSYEVLGKIYRGVKNMAEELNIACWIASQPKIEYWDKDLIGLASLSESSMKQHILDVVMTLARAEGDANRSRGYVAKMRRGASDFTMDFMISFDRMLVKESPVTAVSGNQAQASQQSAPTIPQHAAGVPSVPSLPNTGGFGQAPPTNVGP